MRRTTWNMGAATVAATLALVAGACSGDDGDGPPGDASTPDVELVYASPLAEALNLGAAPDAASKQQEQVSQCMADRGWDYTPITIPGGLEDELGSLDEYAGLFDEDFRTKWGYGISTIYADDGGYVDGAPNSDQLAVADPNEAYVESLSAEEQARFYTDLFGAGHADELTPPDETGAGPTIPGDGESADGTSGENDLGDPNSGSQSDLDTGVPAPESGGLEELVGSCTLAGLGAVDSDDLSRLEQLSTKLDQASTDAGIASTVDLVASSPELEKAQTAWAQCMAAAGHEVATVDDPSEQLSKRLDDILFGSAESPEPDLGGVTTVPAGGAQDGDSEPGFDPDQATTPGGADGGGSDAGGSDAGGSDVGGSEVVAGAEDDAPVSGGADNTSQAFEPAEVDLVALNDLQADELATAQDDRDCQAEFFRPAYLEVRGSVEQRFVDRNADLLDELSKLSGLG